MEILMNLYSTTVLKNQKIDFISFEKNFRKMKLLGKNGWRILMIRLNFAMILILNNFKELIIHGVIKEAIFRKSFLT